MSSWWPKACTNATTLAVVVDGHRDAQVGQVADAALGQIHVVVEEDVAGLDRLDREVAHDRLHQRRVGAAGQLAAVAIVDAAPKSRASRIIGERAVRSIAASTSASAEAKRALDDLSTIGSTRSQSLGGRGGVSRSS